jgi:Arylsulfotransferase (ASST)
VTATTGNLPEDLPIPEYVSGDPDLWWRDGNYIFTSINQDAENWSGDSFWKVIFDRQARVVWALLTPVKRWTLWTDISRDGRTLMWDEITVYDFSSNDPSMIHKMTIDGTIVETVEAEGLHHAWDELADGSLVWGAEITSNEEWLQKRSPDGTVETIWKCSDFETEQLGHTANSCHSNSWWWHQESDTYLVSFPSSAGSVKDTVLHIDSEGNTLSSWGQLSDWSFEDVATTFDYQHGVTFTNDGNLLVSTQLTQANEYYRNNYDTLAVREYELDYDNLVLREVWSFGEDQAIAGKYNGEAHRLADGNTLHNYGTGARLREITPDGTLVWDVKFPDGNTDGNGRLQGRSVFITDLYDFAP